MSNRTFTACDAPACGKAISESQSRAWYLMAYAAPVKIVDGTAPRLDARLILPAHLFCDEHCLATWATDADAKPAAATALSLRS
ncbi:MAG TPA: hypothetical protein VKB67_11100 [Rhizomicrobium sp.]|nr:hypothetical protein [Rhizomicrobium sp.]